MHIKLSKKHNRIKIRGGAGGHGRAMASPKSQINIYLIGIYEHY